MGGNPKVPSHKTGEAKRTRTVPAGVADALIADAGVWIWTLEPGSHAMTVYGDTTPLVAATCAPSTIWSRCPIRTTPKT